MLGLNEQKTTLIGIVTDLVKKSSALLVMGHDLDLSRNEAKSQIGLVPQEFNFNVFLTVEEIQETMPVILMYRQIKLLNEQRKYLTDYN